MTNSFISVSHDKNNLLNGAIITGPKYVSSHRPGRNVVMTTATDEYSVTVPAGATKAQIKLQDPTHTAMVYRVSVGTSGRSMQARSGISGPPSKTGKLSTSWPHPAPSPRRCLIVYSWAVSDGF
jgi:hypothetical protein